MTPWSRMTEDEREAFKLTDAYRDPTNPARVPWGEWSVGAQKELLWAAHKRMGVQVCHTESAWMSVTHANWSDHIAYRIPPEPKRVTLRLFGGEHSWFFYAADKPTHLSDTHILTIPTLDDKPDMTKCVHCGTAPVDLEELE